MTSPRNAPLFFQALFDSTKFPLKGSKVENSYLVIQWYSITQMALSKNEKRKIYILNLIVAIFLLLDGKFDGACLAPVVVSHYDLVLPLVPEIFDRQLARSSQALDITDAF
jgi:hypothetical protein